MQTFSLYVCDMSCSECSVAVKRHLESLAGVCHVNVNLTEGSATVYYKALTHPLEEIQQQVNELGYLGRRQLVPNHQCQHQQNDEQPAEAAQHTSHWRILRGACPQ